MSAPGIDTTWLPKAQAAKLLGVAVRQLERRAKDGYIEKLQGPRKPTERNAPVFYSRVDILALKAGTPNVYGRKVEDVPQPEQPMLRVNAKTSGENTLVPAALPEPLVALLQALAAPPLKPWLPLEEAARFSGLPVSYLRDHAREFGVKTGTDARPRWRFNRAALEVFRP